MTGFRIFSLLSFACMTAQLSSTEADKKLSFVSNIDARSFSQRSHSFGVGYVQQAYPISAQLEGTSGYPNYQLQIRPVTLDVKTQHVLLEFAGLGPASYYNFWLGYKTVIGYAVSATAVSAQTPDPVVIRSAYLSHQQMLGYFIGGIRFYTMLGITSDWLLKAEMKTGEEKLNKVGPDGIFAHSGAGIYLRFGPIILNAELRIPVWKLNYNRQTGIHALFSVGYEFFG